MLIKGKVTDQITGEPLLMAKVRALKSDGSMISGVGAYSKSDGTFQFDAPSDTSKIQISFVGYEPLIVNKTSSSINAPLKSKTLSTVVVTPDKDQLKKPVNWWLIGGLSAIGLIGIGIAVYYATKKNK